MGTLNITEKQKQLLKIIVENLNTGKLKQSIIPSCTHEGCSIIGIDKDFDRNLLGDLESLCDADLMGSIPSRSGNSIYIVKQAGFDTVKNDFTFPENFANPQVNIGAIIQQMNGGNLQASGFVNNSELKQIVNDPDLLSNKMTELTNQLLEAIKAELSTDKLVSYAKDIEELKKEVSSKEPNQSVIKRLLSSLAFMGDIEGAISLTARAWPYLYPLLMIAVERMNLPG
jgi:hypothetical protein